MNPAESGNLANRTTLWKLQKRLGRDRTLAQWMGFVIATVAARPILQEYDAFTGDGPEADDAVDSESARTAARVDHFVRHVGSFSSHCPNAHT